jgi:hypothetical protein
VLRLLQHDQEFFYFQLQIVDWPGCFCASPSRAPLSDNGELAALEKVALQRLADHAQHTENRIWSLVDQVKLALAAAFARRPVIMG